MIHYIRINLLIAIASLLYTACWDNQADKKKNSKDIVIAEPPKPVYEYGFNILEYNIVKDTVRIGDTFGKLLNDNHIRMSDIYTLTENHKDLLNPKDFRAGQPYAKVFSKQNPDSLAYFIYEPAITHYIKVHTRDSLYAEVINRKVTILEKEAGGTIQNNLSMDMINAGVSFSTAYAFSQIFDYTIDFFHLQPDDKFRVIYEERFVDDTIYAGMVKIKAAYFEHKGKPFYAFNFETDSITKKSGFYDENGNMMKRMFLKAPLDIFRITSRFGMRFHPVLHRMKGHFGTDYAAPHGTPIRATASGTVIKAGYNSGNGNFVKIRHNKTYETQYLHMSKILVRQGQYVMQGDIIGKVGSTGLATGPHVCYRFWKNGVQVDPLKEMLPQAEPIEERLKASYLAYIEPLKKQLDQIPYIEAKINQTEIEQGEQIDTIIK